MLCYNAGFEKQTTQQIDTSRGPKQKYLNKKVKSIYIYTYSYDIRRYIYIYVYIILIFYIHTYCFFQ